MATHDYVIANGTGAAVRSDLNGAFAAIVSQNSSATEPSPSYAYQRWADTTAGVMKMRNGANNAWITLYQLDGEWTSIAFENGTAAAPSIYFKDSGTDTGIYSPGADQLAISTGGTGRLFVDASGRVGVGTGSPSNTAGFSQQLQLSGNLPCISIDNIGTGANKYSLGVNGVGALGIWDNTASAFRAYINSSGSVGIGTTSPGDVLDTAAGNYRGITIKCQTTAHRPTLSFFNTTDSLAAYIQATGSSLAFGRMGIDYGGHTETARIDSSGRLLVGTSTSEGAFFNASGVNHLIEAQAQYYMQAWVSNNNSNPSGAILTVARSRGTAAGSKTIVQSSDTLGVLSFQGADGSEFVEAARIAVEVDSTPNSNDMPGRLVFLTTADGAASPTEAMRIGNNGQVSIGVNSVGSFARASLLASTTSGSHYGVHVNSTNTTNGAVLVEFTAATTEVGNITTNGTSSVSYNTTSDYRLKENVTLIPDGIARCKQLKPSRFNFKVDPDHTVEGFIAHEAQAVVPECVTGEKDAVDEDGNPKYQGIDQSKLVPLLTAALQEAIAKIEALETRLTAAGIA